MDYILAAIEYYYRVDLRVEIVQCCAFLDSGTYKDVIYMFSHSIYHILNIAGKREFSSSPGFCFNTLFCINTNLFMPTWINVHNRVIKGIRVSIPPLAIRQSCVSRYRLNESPQST